MVAINCSSCGYKNDFEQPCPFHAEGTDGHGIGTVRVDFDEETLANS